MIYWREIRWLLAKLEPVRFSHSHLAKIKYNGIREFSVSFTTEDLSKAIIFINKWGRYSIVLHLNLKRTKIPIKFTSSFKNSWAWAHWKQYTRRKRKKMKKKIETGIMFKLCSEI